MDADSEIDKVAQAQVKAFMAEFQRQHDIDDDKFKRIVQVAQKNGKQYVTWAWIISALVVLVAFLAERQLSSLENTIRELKSDVTNVRNAVVEVHTKQKLIEQLIESRTKEK